MNYALLFLDRAIQGHGGSVCMSVRPCGRFLVHTVYTISEAYNEDTYVDTTHCDCNSQRHCFVCKYSMYICGPNL